jgi:hypothetical protein
MQEEVNMFSVHRFPSGACEIRFDFHGDTAQDIPPLECRAFMSLGPRCFQVKYAEV